MTNKNMIITQDSFLSALVAKGTVIDCYLFSGIKLSAVQLKSFDVDVLFIRSLGIRSEVQMIYKRCVSTLSPIKGAHNRKEMRKLNDVISDLVDRAECQDA